MSRTARARVRVHPHRDCVKAQPTIITTFRLSRKPIGRFTIRGLRCALRREVEEWPWPRL